MIFPESPRISYSRNPLEQVICQLRFPPILRITAQPPFAFQEAIRGRLPLLKEKKETVVELPAELLKVLPPDFFSSSAELAYEFASEDEVWTVALAKGFVALTSRRYQQWEDFRDLLFESVSAVEREYHPAYLQRIGLRYRNFVQRSKLGLDGVPWSELLRPYILGVLQEVSVVNNVKTSAQEILLSAGPSEQVRIRHGLTRYRPSDEECYLIDADFFTDERVEFEHARPILDQFNVDAGRLFRWCIQERLHNALGPQSLARSDG